MDPLPLLAIGVFMLGAALCTFFMVFLRSGKVIPGDEGGRQVIKYKDIELQTSSIMLLLVVSAVVAVTPLGVQAWLNLRTQSQTQAPTREGFIFLSGELKDNEDANVKLANTPMKATNVFTNQTVNTSTDQEGHFDFDAIRITPEASRIKIVIEREGYLKVERTIVANEQKVPILLSKVQQ